MRLRIEHAPGRANDDYRAPEAWFDAKKEEEDVRGRRGRGHRLDMTRADYCLSCFKTRGVADALSVAEGVAPTRETAPRNM